MSVVEEWGEARAEEGKGPSAFGGVGVVGSVGGSAAYPFPTRTAKV